MVENVTDMNFLSFENFTLMYWNVFIGLYLFVSETWAIEHYQIVPVVVCINSLTVTFRVAVGNSRRTPRTALTSPHNKTVGVLEAEMLKSDVYLQ